MELILLPISMAACLLAGVLGKVFITSFGSNQKLYHLFNIIISAGSALALFAISGGFKVSPFTVYLGLLFGIITAVNKICSLQAMDCGPYSYTAVITSLSTIIPTLSGKFIWGGRNCCRAIRGNIPYARLHNSFGRFQRKTEIGAA